MRGLVLALAVVCAAFAVVVCAPSARACDYGVGGGEVFSIQQQPVYAQQQVVYSQPIVQRQIVSSYYQQPLVQRNVVRSYSAPIVQRQRVRERVVVRPRGRVNVRAGY